MSYKDHKSVLYFGIKMMCTLHNRKHCNIVHYKLRITTASVYLCVQILSAHPLWSISGCNSGSVIVSPSQEIKLYPDNPTHSHPHTTFNALYYVTPTHRRVLGVIGTQWPILMRNSPLPVSTTL